METEDEDWFIESISRYKHLKMFELEQPVQQVELAGANSICVACSNSKRHQLLELSLPSKLLSQTRQLSDNVITSDTDLKIKCGTFTEAMCFQIKTINDCKVIVSHVDTKGVTWYHLSPDSDEIKKENSRFQCPLESPMIATNESHMWLTKKMDDQLFLFNLDSEECVQTCKIDKKAFPDERIVPVFMAPNLVALGCQISGDIFFVDHRVPQGLWNFTRFHSSSGNGLSNGHNFWSFTSLHECSKDYLMSSEENICCVSKTGTLSIYDIRNTGLLPVIKANLGLKTEKGAPLQVRFSPGNRGQVSVSGFDSNVYVYDLREGEDPKLVFTHDGHKHVEGYSSYTAVTSHVWSKLDNLVISGADNGTVQMWQFENKENEVLGNEVLGNG